MNEYQAFASYYDILTSNIPYRKRGEYFHALFLKFGIPGKILLDLACGTGSLSEVFSDLGYDVIGTDSSEEMLMEAMDKRVHSGKDILYLCQSMQNLDLYGTIDGCVCALDSLNHITDATAVQAVFAKVSLFLAPGGLFIFDVNTVYKHEQILSNATFVYDFDEVYCVWQNSVCRDRTVEITLDLFGVNEDGSYDRDTETFSERAYTHEEILGFIHGTDLKMIACYAEDCFDPPTAETQRVIYVAQSTKVSDESANI